MLDGFARVYCMLPKQHHHHSMGGMNLLPGSLLQTGKSVTNGDKFEKFELLKERFKSYRENMLKVGFENLLETHKNTNSGCLGGDNNNNNNNNNVKIDHVVAHTAHIQRDNSYC